MSEQDALADQIAALIQQWRERSRSMPNKDCGPTIAWAWWEAADELAALVHGVQPDKAGVTPLPSTASTSETRRD